MTPLGAHAPVFPAMSRACLHARLSPKLPPVFPVTSCTCLHAREPPPLFNGNCIRDCEALSLTRPQAGTGFLYRWRRLARA